MGILVVGLNHKSASLEVRERLAFDASNVSEALRQLKGLDGQAEFVVLSTCNRVEIYCAGEELPELMAAHLIEFISQFHGVKRGDFEPFVYCRVEEEAVRHLLLVSAGIDSMVVGEAQILGQVKESYKQACAAKSTGKVLNRLFHCAFSTAKSIHTTTSISSGRVSVGGVAVELATQLFENIAQARVAVVGAGEMGQLVVQHLLKMGCTEITVVNRTYDRGVDLARRCRIQVKPWEELSAEVGRANIVISSAGVQDYLYDKTSFEASVRRTVDDTLLIIDLGVPRNFDPAIDEVPGVYVYSLDELKEAAEKNLHAREADIANGLEIVDADTADFMEWLHAKDLGPLIGRVKAEFRCVGRNEMERFFVGPRQEACCRAVMETMVNRVVDKLLHCVIKNVNLLASEAGPNQAARLVDTILQQAKEISSERPKEGGRQA